MFVHRYCRYRRKLPHRSVDNWDARRQLWKLKAHTLVRILKYNRICCTHFRAMLAPVRIFYCNGSAFWIVSRTYRFILISQRMKIDEIFSWFSPPASEFFSPPLRAQFQLRKVVNRHTQRWYEATAVTNKYRKRLIQHENNAFALIELASITPSDLYVWFGFFGLKHTVKSTANKFIVIFQQTKTRSIGILRNFVGFVVSRMLRHIPVPLILNDLFIRIYV